MALEWLNFAGNQGAWADAISNLFLILGWVFWIGIFVGIVWYFVYVGAFNIKVHIYDLVGDKQMLRFVRKAKAKIVTKNGVSKLQLFMIKQQQEPPKGDYYTLCARGKMLNLLKDGVDYKPFKLSANPGTVSVADHDIRFWMTQSVGTIVKKYTEQSFFQKYGTYIVFIFGLLVLGWMYYILMGHVSAQVNQQLSIAQKVAEYTAQNLQGP